MTKNQKLVQAKIEELQAYALSTWGVDVKVTIKYSLNSVRTIGRFFPSKKLIELNNNLLEEYGEKYINDTVVHEFAHAVISYKFPFGTNSRNKRVMPHGREFKAICSHFGNDGRATSSLFNDSVHLKTKTQDRITYKCSCSEYKISKIRHNKILRGASYSCNKCKCKLVKKG